MNANSDFITVYCHGVQQGFPTSGSRRTFCGVADQPNLTKIKCYVFMKSVLYCIVIQQIYWLITQCNLSPPRNRIDHSNRYLHRDYGELFRVRQNKIKTRQLATITNIQLSAHMEESEDIEVESLTHDITEHIQAMISQFEHYFPRARRPVIQCGPRPFQCTIRRYHRR